MLFIGIDLGGTKVSGGLFTSDAVLLKKETRVVAGRRGPEVGQLLTDLIDSLREGEGNIGGVGVSVPGIAYPGTGRVWAPNIPEWEDYALGQEIAALWRGDAPPVRLEGDRNCYILGEAWKGAAYGCRDALFLAVGTGIGLGILSGGQVISGAAGAAGAIGWMGLNRPFREGYNEYGCFEYNASGPGLVRVARNFLALDKQYDGCLLEIEEGKMRAEDIFEAYDEGDLIAERVMAQAIAYWGMAVANLISLFNPEKILLGGGVFGPALRFLPAIMTEAEQWAQPISTRQVEVRGAALGADAGLWGAGFLASQVGR